MPRQTASELGFIVDQTRLRMKPGAEGWNQKAEDDTTFKRDLVWLLKEDDQTVCPYFKSECGKVSIVCYYADNFEVIPETDLNVPPTPPQYPVAIQTPAQKRGIVAGVTQLKLKNSNSDSYSRKTWVVSEDDGSEYPFFSSLCGSSTDLVFELKDMKIVNDPLDVNGANEQTDKEQVLKTFRTMLERAVAYRSGTVFDESVFYHKYGICDNIGRCTPDLYNEDRVTHVKNNVIRQLPSFSGHYHYPVKHPDYINGEYEEVSTQAEYMWDTSSSKWEGEYGGQRVIQLTELIEFLEANWDDSMIEDNWSFAKQQGIVPDAVVMDLRDNRLYTLNDDDKSKDPYFKPLDSDNEDDVKYIHLSHMRVVRVDTVHERTVPEFINRFAEIKASIAEKESIIAKLQAEVSTLIVERTMLDMLMGKQHGVARLDK